MNRTAGSRGGRDGALPPVLPLLLLLLAGLVFWGVFQQRAGASVFGRAPLLDEIYYLDRAAGPVDGGGEPFFMSPLYPLILKVIGSPSVPDSQVFAPGDLAPVRRLQGFFWLATAGLVGLVARRDLSPRIPGTRRRIGVMLLPPVLFLLYRPAAVFAASVMVESLLAFCMAVLLWALPSRAAGGGGRPLAAGLALGAGALLRGSFLILVPVAAFLAWRAGGEPRRRLGAAALVIGVAAAVLAPAVILNSRTVGRLMPPTVNGGVNLYIGNGPEANGFYVAVIPGDWRRDPAGRTYLAERLDTGPLSAAQADSIWAAEARRTMAERPGRTLALWLKKVWLHIQGWEIAQLTPLDAWPREVPLLRWLPVSYGILAALGLGAVLVMGLGRIPGPWSWTILAGALIAGQSLFFVVSRYRLVLVPVLVLLGGWLVAQVLVGFRRRHLVAPVAVLAVLPWGLGDVSTLWKALGKANEARRWAQIGAADGSITNLARSETLYENALESGGSTPAIWLGLAAVRGEQGDAEGAEEALSRGMEAFPDNTGLARARIARLLAEGRPAEALPLLQRVLADHPRDADALHNLAVLLAGSGDPEGALARAEALVEAHPDDPRGFLDKGVILARLGRGHEAAEVFAEGLRRHPGHPDLTRNLELINRETDDSLPNPNN
ncbi:MAG: tetratricopeptide repeat protein [bacterium]